MMLPSAELERAASSFLTRARGEAGIRTATIHGLLVPFDGQGSPLADGQSIRLGVFWDCIVVGWTLISDVAGNLTIDIRRASYTDYPTYGSICGGSPPSLAGAVKNRVPNPTTPVIPSTWSPKLSDGDQLIILVQGAATVNWAMLELRCKEL